MITENPAPHIASDAEIETAMAALIADLTPTAEKAGKTIGEFVREMNEDLFSCYTFAYIASVKEGNEGRKLTSRAGFLTIAAMKRSENPAVREAAKKMISELHRTIRTEHGLPV